MAKEKPTRVRTPKFRVSFPQVFEAKSFQNQPAKFSIQMLFDKKTDLTDLKKVVQIAIKEKWGDKPPKGITLPFKDGSDKELEGYENKIVVGAGSKYKPDVVDQKREPILAQDDFYAGCFARAMLVAYAWELKEGKAVLKRGVSFNLESIQKLSDGEHFVKRSNVNDDFDDVDDDSNDKSNYEAEDESDDLFM